MVYSVVDHKVEDYAKWKPVFDKHKVIIKKAGGKSGTVYRISGEPNHIRVLIEWDKKEDATKFIESEDLKKIMQEARVLGKPDIWFLDKIEDFKL